MTPPAIEFEPTPAELKGKKSKTQTKPQHGRFKISVDDEDVNNFQPTPPPTTTTQTPHKPKPKKQHKQPKRPKPTAAKNLNSQLGHNKNTKTSFHHQRPKASKPKQKTSPVYFVSQDADREDGLITNEIESGSLEKNKVQIVSTSIYDPRPKSRSYKKNYNSYKRERHPKKYNYRNQVDKYLNPLQNRRTDNKYSKDLKYVMCVSVKNV